PGTDLLGGGETNLDGVEVIDVDQSDSYLLEVVWTMRVAGAAPLCLVLLQDAFGFAFRYVLREHGVAVSAQILGRQLLARLQVGVLDLDLLLGGLDRLAFVLGL